MAIGFHETPTKPVLVQEYSSYRNPEIKKKKRGDYIVAV